VASNSTGRLLVWASLERTEGAKVDCWSGESHVAATSIKWRLLLEVELSARFTSSSRSVDTSTAATGLVDARVHCKVVEVVVENALVVLWRDCCSMDCSWRKFCRAVVMLVRNEFEVEENDRYLTLGDERVESEVLCDGVEWS